MCYSKCLTLLNIIDRQYSGETRSNKMELQEMQHLLIVDQQLLNCIKVIAIITATVKQNGTNQ